MKLNNRGVSLVEVVVYMVVSIFIIGYLFNTMSNITKSFSSEKKKTKLQMSGQDVISMLSRDIATTGFKHYLDTTITAGQTKFTLQTIPGTWLGSFGLPNFANNNPDSVIYEASFDFETAVADSFNDELTIFRAKMRTPYDIERIERIRYYLNDTKELIRVTDTFPRVGGNNFNQWRQIETLSLAQDVQALKFFYSEDYTDWSDTPLNPQLVSYIQIKVLMKSDKEGNIINKPSFYLGEDDDGDSITFTPEPDNKHIYRLYERIVEVPSNGRI